MDVSTYQPVVWEERNGQECKTGWVKQCTDKSENVCIDVTETVCEVSFSDATLDWRTNEISVYICIRPGVSDQTSLVWDSGTYY